MMVACSFTPATTLAQDETDDECGVVPPDDAEVTPADKATGVTLDAPYVVRYFDVDLEAFLQRLAAEGEEPLIVFRTRADGTAVRVPGPEPEAFGDLLVFTPDALWEPETEYTASVAAPNQLGRLTRAFRTGTEMDRDPPQLSFTADSVSRSSEPAPPGCGVEDGSQRITLVFDPATDDGPSTSIEWQLFLTRGAGVTAPRQIQRLRNFRGSPNVSFIVGPELATEPICVTALVTDGVGRATEGQEELCFDPIEGNFFEPMCAAVAGPRPGGHQGLCWSLGFLACLLLHWWRRSLGRARRHSHS